MRLTEEYRQRCLRCGETEFLSGDIADTEEEGEDDDD